MTSRDYGFLTLRNVTAYQPNGLPVPPNQVLITSTNGAGIFSNSINLSSITVSTLNTNTIIPSTTLTITGNVLISTNQPGYNLNVVNTNATGTILSLDHSSTQNLFRMSTDTAKFIWYNTGSNPEGNLVPSTLQLSAFNVSIDPDAPGSTALIVDVNGQVGIGSDSLPQAALDVTGQIRVSTSANPSIPSIYFNNDETTGFNSIEPGLIGILAGGLPRMAITSTNVVVDISDVTNLNNNNIFFITNLTNNSTTNVFISNADVNSGTKLGFTTPFSEWDIYTCSPVGGPDGLIPSTLQIKYNMPDPFTQTNNYVDILTLQPNGDLYLTGKISTNTITMNNGYIDSQNGLTVKGVLNISSTTGNDGDASIRLFNSKALITTNITYDGIYLETSDNKPIYLCSTNNAMTYARFSPSSMYLEDNTTVQMANGSIIGISSISSISGTLDITGRIRLVSSSTANPGIYFTEEIDNDTGIYGVGDGKIGFSANGEQRMLITSTDVIISPDLGADFIVSTTNNNNATRAVISNDGTQSTISVLVLETGNGSYGLYATQSEATAFGYGTTPSTFQIYSYYPNPRNVLTIYPSGNTDINGDLTVYGVDDTITLTSTNPTNTVQRIYWDTGNNNGYRIGASNPSYSGGGGWTPGNLDLYVYPSENKLLSISPSGDTTLNGNLNVNGTSLSRVSTTSIGGDPGSAGWTSYYGKYCFVNGDFVGTLTLPTGGDVPLDGTILVIRNIGTTTSITIVNSFGGASILAGKTSSYVYTTSVTVGWYAL